MNKHKSKEAYFERLNELAQSSKPLLKESTGGLGTLINHKKAIDGVSYGIVKEQHKYYIKKGGLKENPDVTDFTYIGGLGNIKDYQYNSLGEADKQRNFLLQIINEAFMVKADNKSSKLVLESAKSVVKETEVTKEGAKEEIAQAEKKIDGLDAATAVAAEPVPDAGLDVQPNVEDRPVPDKTVPIPADAEVDPEANVELPTELPTDGTDELPTDGTDELPTDGTDELPTNGGEEIAPEEKDEIKVHIGKAGQKVMSSDLDTEQIENYIEEFLGYFKKKLATKFDPKQRRDLADKVIINVEQEKADAEADLETSNVVPDEEPALDIAAENVCEECGGFGDYAESRGYNMEAAIEADDDEMGNLVSGYANAHNDGINDGDFKLVALLVNPQILNSLKGEYGHEEYADKLNQEINECGNVKEKIGELWGGLTDAGAIETQPNMVKEQEEIEVETEPEAEEISTEPEVSAEPETKETPAFGGAQNLGVAMVKPDGAKVRIEGEGEAKVEIKDSTVNLTVNEGLNLKMAMPTDDAEDKLRAYIRARLEEKNGIKKGRINESKKSKTLKKLDILIDKQFQLHESTIKK